MRPKGCLTIVGAVLLATTPALLADTPVGGVILTDTTWDLAGSPYVVMVSAGGSIVVGGDATLTIEPDVEVRFEPELGLLVGWSVWGPGTLVARGTAQSPILFTSDQPTPTPGDWGRIDFLSLAADAAFDGDENYRSGCILEHVIVQYGGAGDPAVVNVTGSAPFLSYCEVRDNLKRGIAVSSATRLRIENCYVHDNRDGGMRFASSPGNTLSGNTIEDNTASSEGGGIYFSSSPDNELTGNTISGNDAGYYGGGIDFRNSNSNTLTQNTIEDNTAGMDGAGIYSWDSASNTLTGNTISGNSASAGGGGVYLHYSDFNMLTGNTISGNSAAYDGAGICLRYSGSNTLTGNTIEDNTARLEGGAIHLRGSNDNDPFASNTIRFNHTTDGQTGGIFVTDGSEWLSLNGGTEAYNTICCNDGYDVSNDNPYSGDGRYDIDARNVFWGTDDTALIEAEIYDSDDDASKAIVLWYPFIWDPPAGDLDGDGCVDHADLGILLSDWECTGGDCPGDCDGDGDTDHSDLGILLADWGSDCSCQCE